jgi:predicted DNA-binding transcriptional regulator AlpA
VKTISSIKQFAKRIGRSERHVQRLISEGEGPPVVALGKRAVGIIDDDGDAWIAARRLVPPGWDDKSSAA